jgi:predicted RecB family nuclease
MEHRLEDLIGIGKATADRLKVAGIDSIEKLANIKPAELLKLKVKGVGKATAEKYIENAKIFLKEKSVGKEPKSKSKTKQKVEKEQKAIKKPVEKPKLKKKAPALKELIKKQAECNIGLVGHVDHGIY